MSILSAVDALVPATAPISAEDAASAQLVASIILLCLLAGAIGLAVYVRVFHREKILGPTRIPRGKPLWPLIVSLAVAVIIWLGAQTAYVAVRAVEHTQRQQQAIDASPSVRISGYEVEQPPQPFGVADLTPADFAFLATVPGLIALIVILIGNALVGRAWFTSLGWSWRHLPIGIALGFVASLITLPVVYSFALLLDWFYKFIEYVHPEQHELLGALKSADSDFVRIAMIAGAAIVAPLWEEVAFRGHLQTLIGAGLQKVFGPTRRLAGFPVQADVVFATISNEPASTIETSSPPPLHTPLTHMDGLESFTQDEAITAGPTIAQRWIAIVITSCLFAGVHEMWTWPAIFVLSVCLGYAYERTGNLWVPIVIHLAFNSVSTALFLMQAV